jgi:molybdate transport system ATP-binding protein
MVILDASVGLNVGDLDLEVAFSAGDDEVVAVLGPNGAGKTTLLRALAGLEPLDTGRVVVDGHVLEEPATGAFVPAARRPIATVFQEHLLFPFLTARDNVAFGLRNHGVAKAEARRRADGWLARVGLEGRADARPGALSGGEAQRVALARALAVEPRVLLLDEPLAALDAATRRDVRRELRTHLAEVPGARVLVTHDPVDAATLADRVVVVEHGRVLQHGTIAEVTAHPRSEYVAELVGVNLLRGVARGGTVRLHGGGELVVAAHDLAGEVLAVIRPSAVALYGEAPAGSPRNQWRGRVTDVHFLADRVRAHLGPPVPIVAEVTRQAARDLVLEPGRVVVAVVKATDVSVFPA